MERLLLVRCPDLTVDGEDGTSLRTFEVVLGRVEACCPWVEPVRLGVCTLPARGPSRYFGGETALVERIADAVTAAGDGPVEVGPVQVGPVQVGIADGLFAAWLAATAGTIVAPGGTPDFLAPWPVGVLDGLEGLEQPDLVDLLGRLGLATLGQFAAVGEGYVLARFGVEGTAGHRVAAGRSGELPGLRDPAIARRLAALRQRRPPAERQPGFWGGEGQSSRRAAHALGAVQQLLGAEAVVVAVLQGGRSPLDRVRTVPWDPTSPPGSPGSGSAPAVRGVGATVASPWPGQLPPPAPATVHHAPLPAEVTDDQGLPVRVSSRGLLSSPPVRLSVEGRRWESLARWAGPWPAEERWWSRSRRRLARLQVVTEGGRAHLLAAERRTWWVEATYD